MTPVLTTLANFDGASGQFPDAGLSADAAGDLFGMTATGGAYGYGAVFELVNNGGGGYTPVTLLSFSNTPGVAGSDSGVIADAAGNLFGTIPSGGATGDGAVFELVNHGGGAYTPVTLLSFNGANGALPSAGLIADAAGNLFGTTAAGGANGDGAVFEIAKAGAGYASTPTTLFSFDGASGAGPADSLTVDAAGNLFGVTPSGGANGYGTVFELVRDGGGVYTPVTILSFNGADGRFASSLITDAAGNLFGTTSSGGAYGYGTVFELVNNGGGYTPVTLLSFNGADGANPGGGLIADAAGDLFGTTGEGGAYSAPGLPRGTVFELVNNGGGSYTPVTLLSFKGADGAGPVGSLIADAAGDLFGATAGGGTAGDGTAFEITNSGFVTKGSTPPPATSSNILWRNSNGDVALWNGNGSGGFTGQDLGIVGTSWQIEETGDFNGSGEDGILWRNTNGDAYLWNSNGSGGFTGEDLGVVASSWQIEGTGDFNGSGERRHPVAQYEWGRLPLELQRLGRLYGRRLGRRRLQLADRGNWRFQWQRRRRHPVAEHEWGCLPLELQRLGRLYGRRLGRRRLQLADRRNRRFQWQRKRRHPLAEHERGCLPLELQRLGRVYRPGLRRCRFQLADPRSRRFQWQRKRRHPLAEHERGCRALELKWLGRLHRPGLGRRRCRLADFQTGLI